MAPELRKHLIDYWFITKDDKGKEWTDEEIYRAKPGRVLSTGASDLVELGVPLTVT